MPKAKNTPAALSEKLVQAAGVIQQQSDAQKALSLSAIQKELEGARLHIQALTANCNRDRLIGYRQGIIDGWCAALGIDPEGVTIAPDGKITTKE